MTIAEPGIASPPDLGKVSDTDWQIAEARYAAIRPLLETERCTATEVARRAQQVGVHMVTLYRWLKCFKASGQRSALLPDHPNGGRGQSRLSDAAEALLSAIIEDHYLTTQKPSVAATYQELRRRCRQVDVKVPHFNTLRARIARIAGPVRLGRREGARVARDRYAPEFRGAMLQRACAEYGIDLHWRPVGRPQFGGHIERLCGTLNQAIHMLPGTTFSNPAARGGYPSEQKAAMTLDELERWLAVYITQVYHQKLHHGIGLSPLKKYEQGLLGHPERLGSGRRPLPADPERLRLDFLPYVERTVQPYGLRIDEIYYYHDVLKPWIHAARPGAARGPRTFVVRRDPRDISTVFFFDPELNQYFPIPYRRLAAPSMSLWELREVRRRLKAEGRHSIDENALFAGYERLRQIEAQAIDTTQNRRRAQRRDHHRQREPFQIAVGPTPPPDAEAKNLTDTITPFADRQVGRRRE